MRVGKVCGSFVSEHRCLQSGAWGRGMPESGPQPMVVWSGEAEGIMPRVWVEVKAHPDFIPQVTAQNTVLFSKLYHTFL